ncbi:apolipoprotein D-like [Mizuhopecten yessoensis]|uniref:apolipoprotein D-like n=1 Tax=Mizuhopecten yessoensis TaxID=6573 RepID=UPI000B45E748|nr:apolipoprotein D-like [Mizuhopecten yessoensis]
MSLRLMFLALLFGIISLVIGLNPAKSKEGEPGTRGCPNPPTQVNFNLNKFTGNWHEHFTLIPAKSFSHVPLEFKCPTTEIVLYPGSTTNGSIRVNSIQRKTGYKAVVNGNILTPDPKEPAKLAVKFSPGSVLASYWVLATDYLRFALVYSCSPNPIVPVYFEEHISVLTRKTGELLGSIHYTIERLTEAHFKDRKLRTVLSDQTRCGTVKLSKKTFFSDIV